MGGCAFKALAVRPPSVGGLLKYCAPNLAGPTKPFSGADEANLKQTFDMMEVDQTTVGFDHVGIHPQLNLPRISQKLAV
jgi:hypothetical protein